MNKQKILEILDECCREFTFPMLDNGYLYLAATRLSLFGSKFDWALVIETFGYNNRSGLPDLQVSTFSNNLHNRDQEADYVSGEAHQDYLNTNPYNESRFFEPIDEGSWRDENDIDLVNPEGKFILREKARPVPPRSVFIEQGIELDSDQFTSSDFCRCVAAFHRDDVLGTESERRISVPPEMKQLLVLDEWHHPDVAAEELPSEVDDFLQFANILSSAGATKYHSSLSPNTHWKNWPEGGSL